MISAETLVRSDTGICYIKNRNSCYLASSPNHVYLAGYTRNTDKMIGLSDYDFSWAEFADEYIEDDKQVLQGKKIVTLHRTNCTDKKTIPIITHKIPIYDNNNIIAIYGRVTLLPTNVNSKTLSYLQNNCDNFVNLSSDKYGDLEIRFEGLTVRQSEVLFYLLRGKTAKMIANLLNISERTATQHIENIKLKINVDTKAEILDYAYQKGYLKIIPYSLL